MCIQIKTDIIILIILIILKSISQVILRFVWTLHQHDVECQSAFSKCHFLYIQLSLYNAQVQTAVCQWLLTVQLHQFQNPNNVIKSWINEGLCCCHDIWPVACDIDYEFLNGCDNPCNTWFSVSVPHCLSPPSCSVPTPTHYDTSSVVKLDYIFVFLLEDFPDQVSKICM